MWGVINGKKLVCVLPAYNAAKTLEKTIRAVPPGIVDCFILVDDSSVDNTSEVAQALSSEFPIFTHRHPNNRGYGGNQKTCYGLALEKGADIVVMLHPDYQYEPRLLGAMAQMVASGVYGVVLGSRIIGDSALKGGMPLYKYVANRFLTLFQNVCIGKKLSEYHTGYRAFSSEVLHGLRLDLNSDDFVFDNEMIVQAVMRRYPIGEISVPTKYFEEASSISFSRSVKYGFGVLRCSFEGLMCRLGFWTHPRYR